MCSYCHGQSLVLIQGMIWASERQRASDEALRRFKRRVEARLAERTAALTNEIAERMAAEAQLRQIQKMEAVGQLTGGIAHDFNNMLAVVIGGSTWPARLMPALRSEVERCIESGHGRRPARGRGLTSACSPSPASSRWRREPVDANELIGGMSRTARRTLGEPIGVETVLAAGSVARLADPHQLESAILNLAVNARDAMPERRPLTIETENAYSTRAYARALRRRRRPYVLIAVTDTGIGHAARGARQAFDPFFTTKPVGKGTGLGLSQVFGFVRQSGGHVKSTRRSSLAPRSRSTCRASQARPVRPTASTRAAPGAAGKARPSWSSRTRSRSAPSRSKRCASSAIRCSRPATRKEALQRPRAAVPDRAAVHRRRHAGHDRPRARDRAAHAPPALKVLFTTGYTRNAIVHNGMLDPEVAFLAKPFTRGTALPPRFCDALAQAFLTAPYSCRRCRNQTDASSGSTRNREFLRTKTHHPKACMKIGARLSRRSRQVFAAGAYAHPLSGGGFKSRPELRLPVLDFSCYLQEGRLQRVSFARRPHDAAAG